jgi:hypothetical protein
MAIKSVLSPERNAIIRLMKIALIMNHGIQTTTQDRRNKWIMI